MKKNTKLIGTIILSITALVGFNSCAKNSTKETLRVSYFPGALYDPLTILSDSKGWFKEEGINVEILSFANGPAANEAIVSGDLDVVYAVGDQPFVTQVARGVDGIVISAATRQCVNLGIAARDGINSVQDLKGKKIAVGIGTMNHKNLLAILGDFGLSESDVEIINGSGTEAYNSLQKGDIDAVYYGTAWALKQTEDAGGHKIIDGHGNYANTYTYTTRTFAEKHEELITRFLKVLYKAENYVIKNPDKAYEEIAAILNVTPEQIRIINTGNIWATGLDESDVEHITGTYKFLYERNYIKTKIDDFNQYVEPKYVREAYKLYTK